MNHTDRSGVVGDMVKVEIVPNRSGVVVSRKVICRFNFISLPAVEIPMRQLPGSYPIRLSVHDAVQVYRTPPNLYIYFTSDALCMSFCVRVNVRVFVWVCTKYNARISSEGENNENK